MSRPGSGPSHPRRRESVDEASRGRRHSSSPVDAGSLGVRSRNLSTRTRSTMRSKAVRPKPGCSVASVAPKQRPLVTVVPPPWAAVHAAAVAATSASQGGPFIDGPYTGPQAPLAIRRDALPSQLFARAFGTYLLGLIWLIEALNYGVHVIFRPEPWNAISVVSGYALWAVQLTSLARCPQRRRTRAQCVRTEYTQHTYAARTTAPNREHARHNHSATQRSFGCIYSAAHAALLHTQVPAYRSGWRLKRLGGAGEGRRRAGFRVQAQRPPAAAARALRAAGGPRHRRVRSLVPLARHADRRAHVYPSYEMPLGTHELPL